MRRTRALRRRRTLLFNLVAGLLVVMAGVLLVRITHFNFLTGDYSYDPRTDQPSRLVLANRPDLVLVDALTKQLDRDGTYPTNATVKVVRIEPIHVAVSIYTDFQVYAFVTTRLAYADGTARIEEFRFHSVGSDGADLPLINGVSYHAFYARLADCREIPGEPAGKSVCGLQ